MACFFRPDLDQDRTRRPAASCERLRNIPHSLAATLDMISVISVGQVGCRFQPVHITTTTTTTIPNRQQTNRPKTPLSLPPTLPPVPTSPTLPFPLPNTPLLLGLALARSRRLPCPEALKPRPQIGSPHTEPHPFVYSPHTPFAALPICLPTPCPVRSLSADGCALGDAPGLKPLSNAVHSSIPTLSTRPSLRVPSGSSARRFGGRPHVRRALATYHLHPTFEFWSSEDEDKDDNFVTLI